MGRVYGPSSRVIRLSSSGSALSLFQNSKVRPRRTLCSPSAAPRPHQHRRSDKIGVISLVEGDVHAAGIRRAANGALISIKYAGALTWCILIIDRLASSRWLIAVGAAVRSVQSSRPYLPFGAEFSTYRYP